MKIFKLILAANEVRGVDISGQYFELRKALYTVDVELLTKDGGIVSLLPSATESDYTREGVFQTVIITNGATPQTIEFWYGFGDAGSRRFSGNVSGTVDLGAATLAALESVDLNAATQLAMIRPLLPGASFSSNVALAAGAAQAVFLPAANAGGAIIHAAQCMDLGVGMLVLIAKAGAAPTSITDGEIIAMPQVINAGSYCQNLELKNPARIAPGMGLYFISTMASSGSVLRTTRHTFL